MINLNENFIEQFLIDYATMIGIGIKIEDIHKEQYGRYGFLEKQIIKFSVPESSTFDRNELLEQHKHFDIHSSDGLMKAAKEILITMTFNACNEDDWIKDADKKVIEDMFKFYGKVRKGETWTTEDGQRAIDNFLDQFKAVKEYKEV